MKIYEDNIKKYNEIIKNSNLAAIYNDSCTYYNCDYREEKNNSTTYGYNVPGIRVKCEEIWDNKSKKLSLKFYGKAEILNKESTFERLLPIDTYVYDKYDWYVKDGILYITLFEKINDRPNFSRVEKTKKNKTKQSKEDENKETSIERY